MNERIGIEVILEDKIRRGMDRDGNKGEGLKYDGRNCHCTVPD
jgi:hypothetical protein